MLVTKVELENIKSYETAEYEFRPGVTAISGPNGAGKTTILEAIAWALFDSLPYRKEDFLRRGARKGSVRVTFRSAVDEREYTVYRDTGTGYYVYDPVTRMRLVEQKNQVGNWIRQHLGVEPGADLKTLFTSTIGVPQGTFAVDFLDQPARRKAGFDRVLRVEDYQKSADELRTLVRLIEARQADLREEIARLEVEVETLDGALAERAGCETRIRELGEELTATEQARERTRLEVERFGELQRLLEQLTGAAEALRARLQEIERRRAAVGEEVERARRASEVVEATAEGFALYNEAEAALAGMQVEAEERDRLLLARGERERELIRVEASLEALEEKLRHLALDREELARLGPLVEEQERLEARRAALQTAIGELSAVGKRVEEVEREREQLRRDYQHLSREIEEAEKLRPLAEMAPQLEAEREALEARHAEARLALQQRHQSQKELQAQRNNVARYEAELQTLAQELAGVERAERLAATLPHLEKDERALTEEIAGLRAEIARARKTLAQVRGGLCPLLAEPCRNMKPGQTLEQYFKTQTESEGARLANLEERQAKLRERIGEARLALEKASGVRARRAARQRSEEDLEISRREVARLESEIAAVAVDDALVRDVARQLQALDARLKEARHALVAYESLNLLRRRFAEVRQEGLEKKALLDELHKRMAGLDELRKEAESVEGHLRELDDPRGRARALEQAQQREPELLADRAGLEGRRREVGAALQSLSEELERFAGLEDRLAEQRAVRAANERFYRAYLENQPVAALLAGREAELREVVARAAEREAELRDTEVRLAETRALYDEGRHREARVRLDELSGRAASLTTELNHAEARRGALHQEIERLMQSRQRMMELTARAERNLEVSELAEFIRDLLRRAGPYITEAHLQSISMEANQLYREICGNPMISLRWDAGYEVVLEEDGHERPFASLSGGEQMAAALAVRLALLKELSEIRIAFFDEPTTNMDEERRRNLAQQIGRIKDFDQLFVISHDDAFEGFTDHIVTVRGGADRA